jgi:hypothetical protein
MADQDLLVSRLAQAVKEFGESRPLIHREGMPGADYQEVTGNGTGGTRPGTPAAGSRPAPRDNR